MRDYLCFGLRVFCCEAAENVSLRLLGLESDGLAVSVELGVYKIVFIEVQVGREVVEELGYGRVQSLEVL